MTSSVIIAMSTARALLIDRLASWRLGPFNMHATRFDRLVSFFENPVPARTMAAFHRSFSTLNEEKVLNIIWVAIVGLEIMMILGVAVKSIVQRLSYNRPSSMSGRIAL